MTGTDEASPAVCYVTTVGRVSGHPHRIEIWYLEHGDELYLLSGNGERADWVRNMRAHPDVVVELPPPAARTFPGTRPYTALFELLDDDRAIREAMAARYQGWTTGEPLSDWATDSLVVRLSPA
jgi:deazaflavin-dependent oxidoreductase (nitroreductase family)